MGQIRRRQILIAGSVLLAAPLAIAQQAEPVRQIGVLMPTAETDSEGQAEIRAFREEFQRLGWTDGRNMRMHYRWARGDPNRIKTAAKELVALRPDAIFARTTPVTVVLARETRTIPIVFAVVSDPVGDQLVASLARPGGNVTGFTNVEASLGGKWLQLLKEIAPRISRVALLFDPKMAPRAGTYYRQAIEEAALSLSVKTTAVSVHDAASIEHAIQSFAREPNGGLLVLPDATLLNHRNLIISLAAEHRLPAIYQWSSAGAAGGLLTYGVNFADLYRRAATYVDRILRGEKPADLPVQAPVKFDLVINSRTARALGLTIPTSIRLRADQVIE